MDVKNFTDFNKDEYSENLLRLGIKNHKDLVGNKVYYSLKVYGEHVVIEWNQDRAEFLLELDGQRFWSNPFKIFLTNN
jgi:hypothetical protein